MSADQTYKFDSGKLRYGLIPQQALRGVAEVLTFGASKYSPNSWQLVETWRFVDSIFRHLEAYRAGEMIDPESGLPHMAHVSTNAMFLQVLEPPK